MEVILVAAARRLVPWCSRTQSRWLARRLESLTVVSGGQGRAAAKGIGDVMWLREEEDAPVSRVSKTSSR